MIRRTALAVAVLVTAFLLQVTVVDRLGLPLGHPDVVLVCVVALALVGGPEAGAGIGFAAGLAVDALPPADHTLGRLALAYAVAGYVAGLLEDAEERSALTTVAVVAAGSMVAVLLFAGVGGLLGDPRITASGVIRSLTATVTYDVVLAPFVVPLVAAAARRAAPFDGER